MQRRKFMLGAASSAVLATTGCVREEPALSKVISAPAGRIQGHVTRGVHRFLGIPYADPPFGERRWMPPVRRKPWSHVLQATKYGQICPQTGGNSADPLIEGEDCLNLNIWSADPSARGLPVMVWVHGGGQISGSGADKIYDGSNFAKDGVVLVTCNRRLGAEGFLYLEELFGDGIGPGNLGMQDLICVLQWVADNIQSFGGDPSNITIFGESGGAAAIQATIATPGAGGLINQAILQSGGHSAQRPDTAKKIARYVIDQLAIGHKDLDALRLVPWQKFVDLYPNLSERLHWGQPQIYQPVLNEHMPVHPVDATFSGVGLDIAYLIGTCRDEAELFAWLTELEGSQFDRRARQVIKAAGAEFSEVIARYGALNPSMKKEDCFTAALGDMWFRVPSLRIAEGHRRYSTRDTYMYLFEWASPILGATHALDLMVFGNGLPLSFMSGFRDFDKTANFMRKAWVAFAQTGTPKTADQTWPRYSEKRSTLSIKDTPTVMGSSYQDQFPMLEPVINIHWGTAGL